MRKPFNPFEALILRKMTEALFHDVDMAISPRQVVGNIQEQFSMIEGNKPREIALTLWLLCLVLGGPFFILMPVHWRARRIARRLQRTRSDLLQDLARTRGIIYAGYYGHWQGVTQDDNRANPVLTQIDFTLPAHRVRGEGEVPIELFDGRDLTHEDFVGENDVPDSAEVIVIGSGAGGAVAAASLAAHGHKVLVIEAGPHYPSTRLTHEERRMTARLFVDGGIQTSRDHDVIVFQGRCVGGSTVINNGICLRLDQPGLTHPDAVDVLGRWANDGAPIDRDSFRRSYEAVEHRLGVEEIAHRSGRHNGVHLLDAWARHVADDPDPRNAAAPATWFSKNYGPRSIGAECSYCGYCNTGCPYGRKQGTAQSFLIDACRKGARILAEARVEKIEWKDEKVGGKLVADGVWLTLAGGGRRYVKARKGVVVAGGTMASSNILDKSGIEGTGQGISLNIASPVVALAKEGTNPRSWDEDQMATYVDRGDFLIESHFQPPMSMATLVPGWFGEHARRMQSYGRLVSAGILFPADRRGRLIDGRLRFKLDSDVDLPLLRTALATLSRVHFANGAVEVYPPLARGQTLRPGKDIDRFFERTVREADDVVLSSSHPHGGNGINLDPTKGVVDPDCRLHAATNVLVTDASVFPSCIRVNAQLTTMAMAHHATARHDPFAGV